MAVLYKKLGQFQKAALASHEASRLMGTANQRVPSSPPPDVEQDLPADELAKLDGRAQISGGQIAVKLYNGADWYVSSVKVRVIVPDQNLDRDYPLRWELPFTPPDPRIGPSGEAAAMGAEILGQEDYVARKDRELESQGLNPARAETTAPGAMGSYSGTLGFATVTAGEKWSWQIVSAGGFPPK